MRISSRGIFSFMLVLIFLIGYIGFFAQENYSNAKIGKAIVIAMELEKGNFLRTVLEENSDRIIEEELEKGLREKNIQARILEERIAGRLVNYFSEMREEYGVEFFVKEKGVLFEVREELSVDGLKELFSVNVVNFGVGVFGECEFHGGLLKNKVVVGEIRVGDSKSLFEIPIGYYISETVER